jgi:hypothetical protein
VGVAALTDEPTRSDSPTIAKPVVNTNGIFINSLLRRGPPDIRLVYPWV